MSRRPVIVLRARTSAAAAKGFLSGENMDDRLILHSDLTIVELEITQHGNGPAADRLRELEPAVFDYIEEAIQRMAGELTLKGVDPAISGRIANRMMTTFITVLEATSRATYRT